ncbi:MAG: hypothetical protein WAT79_15530 [Saprospiraceae bacterium]
MRYLLLACIVFVQINLFGQAQTFTLFNGIEFEGSLLKVTNDSIFILTTSGNKVSYHLTQISKKNAKNVGEFYVFNNQRKYFNELDFTLVSGNQTHSLISALGFNGRILYRYNAKKQQFLTLNLGIESTEAYLPVYIVPLLAGYQCSFYKKPNCQIYAFGHLGYGFADFRDLGDLWVSETVKGGFRLDYGMAFYIRSGVKSSIFIKSGLTHQNLSFEVSSPWDSSKVDQVLRNLFFKIGVLF